MNAKELSPLAKTTIGFLEQLVNRRGKMKEIKLVCELLSGKIGKMADEIEEREDLVREEIEEIEKLREERRLTIQILTDAQLKQKELKNGF